MVLTASLLMTGCVSSGYGNYSNANMFSTSMANNNTVAHLAAVSSGRTIHTMKQPAKPSSSVRHLFQRLRSRVMPLLSSRKTGKPQSAPANSGTTLWLCREHPSRLTCTSHNVRWWRHVKPLFALANRRQSIPGMPMDQDCVPDASPALPKPMPR